MSVFNENYNTHILHMSAFIGLNNTNRGQKLVWELTFGGDRLSCTIDELLISYICSFESRSLIRDDVFDDLFIYRWETVNELICAGFKHHSPPSNLTNRNLSLAALAAFPLIEDLSRRVSNLWTNEGKVKANIGRHFNLLDGNGNIKEYNTGKTISNFNHKMQLMICSSSQETQTQWSAFDDATRKPSISGLPNFEKPPSLFGRLGKRRNSWAHGFEYDGWEGILISLIIGFIYWSRLVESTEQQTTQ